MTVTALMNAIEQHGLTSMLAARLRRAGMQAEATSGDLSTAEPADAEQQPDAVDSRGLLLAVLEGLEGAPPTNPPNIEAYRQEPTREGFTRHVKAAISLLRTASNPEADRALAKHVTNLKPILETLSNRWVEDPGRSVWKTAISHLRSMTRRRRRPATKQSSPPFKQLSNRALVESAFELAKRGSDRYAQEYGTDSQHPLVRFVQLYRVGNAHDPRVPQAQGPQYVTEPDTEHFAWNAWMVMSTGQVCIKDRPEDAGNETLNRLLVRLSVWERLYQRDPDLAIPFFSLAFKKPPVAQCEILDRVATKIASVAREAHSPDLSRFNARVVANLDSKAKGGNKGLATMIKYEGDMDDSAPKVSTAHRTSPRRAYPCFENSALGPLLRVVVAAHEHDPDRHAVAVCSTSAALEPVRYGFNRDEPLKSSRPTLLRAMTARFDGLPSIATDTASKVVWKLRVKNAFSPDNDVYSTLSDYDQGISGDCFYGKRYRNAVAALLEQFRPADKSEANQVRSVVRDIFCNAVTQKLERGRLVWLYQALRLARKDGTLAELPGFQTDRQVGELR